MQSLDNTAKERFSIRELEELLGLLYSSSLEPGCGDRGMTRVISSPKPEIVPAPAWSRLPSGRKLNILDPDPFAWTDADLAIGLSRAFRWGGYSQWPLPLPVAQHSLMVMVLVAIVLGRSLTVSEYRRELLHDSDEALIGGFDAIRPLKPVLGEPFREITDKLLQAAFVRYDVPHWTPAEYDIHKHADHLSAASEAVHVAGWTPAEIRDMLQIHVTPLTADPLAEIYDCRPWEPWAPDVAAERFLEALNGQGRAIEYINRLPGELDRPC